MKIDYNSRYKIKEKYLVKLKKYIKNELASDNNSECRNKIYLDEETSS